MANAPTQNQDGRFSAIIAQTSASGSNVSHLVQDLDQIGQGVTGGSNIVQRQFGEGRGEVDQTIGGDQAARPRRRPRSTSRSRSQVEVEVRASRGAGRVSPSTSGSRGRDSRSRPVRSSAARRRRAAIQDRTRVRIRQDSKQTASQDSASQSQSLTGECTTVGDCGIRQLAQNDRGLDPGPPAVHGARRTGPCSLVRADDVRPRRLQQRHRQRGSPSSISRTTKRG